jgi:hypothetical protein
MRLHHEEASLSLPRIKTYLSAANQPRGLDFWKEVAE